MLSCHEISAFVVRKELVMHPAVPEFNYNAAEMRQFIDTFGSL